ncbi:MAG: DUF6320 domain-containing protein, partial [Bacilli bacterium]
MYCEYCHVTVTDNLQKCPLCQNKLTKQKKIQTSSFPQIPTILKQYNLLFKSLSFLSVITCLISLFINYIVSPKLWWSIFVILGVISAWITVITTIKKRHNLSHSVFYQTITIIGLTITWDILTGWHSWSIDYILPIITIIAIVTSTTINKVMKLKPENTLIYFMLICLLGITSLILLLFNCLTTNYPSIICTIVTTIAISALVIFEGKTLLEELKKRLHL